MKKKQLLFVLSCVFIYTVSFGQNRIYVDSSNVSGTYDGTSWATAFDSIQVAINSASSGDSIFVAKGTYQVQFGASYIMKEGVKIFGGFSATDNTFALRDWNMNPTILQGNGSHVFYNSGNNLTNASVLNGFTVIAGSSGDNGGGMYNNQSSPTIRYVKFTQNSAANDGGAIYNNASSPILDSVYIYSNYASSYGGGISNEDGATPTLKHVAIYNNNSDDEGGGIYNSSSSPLLNSVSIYNNYSASYGGGISNENASAPLIKKVLIYNNYAAYNGGGVYSDNSSPVLTNVILHNDSSQDEGGGICSEYGGTTTLTNVVFYSDSSGDGGAIASDGVTFNVTNCTFYHNLAGNWSAIDSWNSSNLTINNSIFWDNINYGSSGPNDIDDEDGTAIISYNYTQSGFSSYSTSNIIGSMNPFADTTNIAGADNMLMTADDGLELACGSHAINKGSNSLITSGDTTDITGAPRIRLGTVDMGAYENSTQTESTQTVTACGNYVWQSVNRTTSGIYSDTIPNSVGCDSIMFLNLTINPYANTTLVQVQNSLVATTNGVGYQWIFCDSSAISGANDQSYTATQNGSYAVILTTTAGCADTSACHDLTATGVQNYSSTNSVSIYPMPNNGNFTVTFTGLGYKSITIYDETGKKVVSKVLDENNSNTSIPLNLSEYPSGIYIAEILTTHGLENKKILIQK